MPDGLSDFAEALANPIKYQSELEKRSEQLAVLLSEDVDTTDEDANNSCKKRTFSLFKLPFFSFYFMHFSVLCIFCGSSVTHFYFHFIC